MSEIVDWWQRHQRGVLVALGIAGFWIAIIALQLIFLPI